MNLCITIDQKSCISYLSPIEYDLKVNDDLDNVRKLLQSKIGQILLVSNQARPDVCYDVSYLSTNLPSLSRATMRDVLLVNRIIRKLKGRDITLAFQPLNNEKRLVAFTDT